MLYQLSWTILLAPLLAFAVIIFGTRVWDLLSRPRVATPTTTHDDHHSHDAHELPGSSHGHDDHAVADHGHDAHGLDDDEDPKVPALSTGAKVSAYAAIAIMALACLYSWTLLIHSLVFPDALRQLSPDGKQYAIQVLSYTWLNLGTLNYTITFQLDHLAITMLVVVTTIALLVQFYSQGYMENSAGYARFYAYLSLFAFSMLVIVFAQNFLVIFCGWELVGLSSYLLIGFWINKRARPEEQRPAPAGASLQAFVMNRIGDVGFILGIMILFVNTGSFEFSKILPGVQHMDKGLLAVAMLLVFCGAIGKSAQLPLHTWLPSAMEGPTPVSALIHAATMVAAGVYMVARTYPLFASADPIAFQVVAWVGTLTAFFAATIALVQSDFKRVLAFSTISQLGYMFAGLGIAGPEYGAGPGMFHLFTHAFFKALLFLGAGSVLHGLHHAMHKEVQDVRLMGGLATRMPITAFTWLVATMAISGFPFFSGFYSKEEIIGLAFEHQNWGIYVLTLLTAGMTAFYMLRAFILAFGGPQGKFFGLWGGTYRGTGEVHESPRTMTIPLLLLTIPSVLAGYWFNFFTYATPGSEEIHNLDFVRLLSSPDTWVGVLVSFVGLGIALGIYGRIEFAKIGSFVESNAVLRTAHRILFNRYYIDDLYNWIAQGLVLGGISRAAQLFDTYIVDGVVNGVAQGVTGLGRGMRHLETGRVQSYMIGFFGGVAILAVLVIVLVTTVVK
ncbi:NADH-quinone oxidoreductase subunit L [Tengunoibacter tsumagoiensis]|uniref:NADH-quinone oxidoreductase subunit L n=1 Tax=Tengunoibacter tsumagoiensis TaxID=2014871 RepID=A0A401ZX57_9CHLR|nr:NADH-quinone oxidoreductase subunit L [Tengunoibacter tsumagoiensis]GCE11424.1 NADH-quinone oxidoreductase subunit L [Tengunoibacter tsumagoiensis]